MVRKPQGHRGETARDHRFQARVRDKAKVRDGVIGATGILEQSRVAAGGTWEALLDRVRANLNQLAGEPRGAAPRLSMHHPAGRLHARVQSCTAALDQLHASLVHEQKLREQLEQMVADARTALAQARTELAGSRDGERRARHLALHDNLTALPNGGYFREQLDQALVNAVLYKKSLAVLYLDLDGFKPINDAHGHHAGDELLRIVAARLTRSVRAEDVVSRLGGDEFACLLTDLPRQREKLERLARKVFDAVSAPLQIDGLKLAVRASIGIAVCPDDGVTADALLRNADAAMYRAKRLEGGFAFFAQ